MRLWASPTMKFSVSRIFNIKVYLKLILRAISQKKADNQCQWIVLGLKWGIVNLLHSTNPQSSSLGSNGGVELRMGTRKMDLLVWEGERVIWNPGHWLVEMRLLMSLWWHSVPDICLALNNSPDTAGEWWPAGRLTLQPVPRWATSGHFLLPWLPLFSPHLSFPVSGLSIRIHMSDGCFSEAYSWHAGVFISTSNPFRVGCGAQSCHWQATQASAPPSIPPHDLVSLQRSSRERFWSWVKI